MPSMHDLPPFLLFDLDDTLVVFSSGRGDLWEELSHRFAPRLALEVPPLLAALRAAADDFWHDPATQDSGRLELVRSRRIIVDRALDTLGSRRVAVGQEMADTFTWTREQRVAPLPGALETLTTLRARGHRLGLVTNGSGPFQRRKIERFGFAQYFDDIRVEGEQGLGKPHAPVFESALSALGARPQETWMIGDNLVADIAGAQAVGIRGVWVDIRGQGAPPADGPQPDAILESVADLVSTASSDRRPR